MLCWHLLQEFQETGALYQSRFKSFAVVNSESLWTVIRYIERNSLYANLVKNGKAWRWLCLGLRTGTGISFFSCAENLRPRLILCPISIPLPWIDYVEKTLSDHEREQLEIA